MGIIKKLPTHEAHKIAAGEVVERPANALKELIENALDAHATAITIYCTDGGQTLLRVVDNGIGMAPDDAQICFEHHATSKISTVDDLATISSFGFRGEALTSIAAISKITLITRTAHAQVGTEIKHENSKIISAHETACSIGTDIRVHDLFYNVPARKKFLKTVQTEWRHSVQLFQAFCFAYPQIHFTLYCNETLIHNCPPVKTVADRAFQLWELSLAHSMISLEQESSPKISVNGIISKQQIYRYDRSSIFLYVNNRWVKNPHLVKAVIKGYLNILPPERFPAAVIMINAPTDSVDINIHPRKEEIQFAEPRMIENILKATITKTLEIDHAQRFSSTSAYKTVPSAISTHTKIPQSFGTVSPFPSSPTFTQFSASRATPQIAEIQEIPAQLHTVQNFVVPDAKTAQIEQKNVSDDISLHIAGTLYDTYILVQTETDIIFIDQHAAHERILYEQFKNHFGSLPTIELLFPLIISLTAQEQTILRQLKTILSKHAIHIDELGPDRIVVHAIPVHLKNSPLPELIKEIASTLDDQDTNNAPEITSLIHEKVHAMMACKAAVKAGDILTQEQQMSLVKDLYTTKNRIACPHGRPTLWSLPLYDLEKKFKRKL